MILIERMDQGLPSASIPERRQGPPWAMEEMIAAEPGLVSPILSSGNQASPIARAIEGAVSDCHPIVVTGCGTSETAALGVAGLIVQALDGRGLRSLDVRPEQALEASFQPWRQGVCIGISHEASTRATILALEAARAGQGTTVLVTARPQGEGARAADHVFATPLVDRSWCHTVAYLSPLLAGASEADVSFAVLFLLELAPQAARLAQALFGVDWIITAGSGADRSPARELALKLCEGPRIPAQMLDLETTLHGHLAASDRRTGLVIVATGDQARPLTRAAMLARAARGIGVRVGAILSPAAAAAIDPSLTEAGRIVLPASLSRHGLIGRLCGAALALQRLTLSLVGLSGVNPDLIRTDEAGYREAAHIAFEEVDW